ncbi:MAG: response regulator transcription factor [Burkholderiales bacterium]
MPIRVILVDDHRMLRDALIMVLGGEPDIDVVSVAEDGVSAIERAREHDPDVLVLDIAMPGMNGVQVAQVLRKEMPRIRILALSAYMDKRFVQEILKAGASGYVTKAAAATELPRAIRAVAAGQNYLSPEITSAVVSQFASDGGTGALAGSPLSAREREVLRLVADGVRTAAIGRRLGITEGTVEAHRRNVMRKLEIRTVAELTKYAVREGITSL